MMHPDKLRWLAWLRVKLFIRMLSRSPRRLIIVTVTTMILMIMVGNVSSLLYKALTTATWLTPIGQGELFYPCLTGILILWLVMPLLSYTTNEGLDVTKLQIFPVTRLEMMFSMLFSSLFGLGTVFLLFIFGIMVVALGMHSLAAAMVALLILAIFYVATISLSQLIMALLASTLQSRRFRDLSILVLVLGSSSCYLLSRFAISAHTASQFGIYLNRGTFSPYLQWLPSGVAAGALRAALQGNLLTSVELLGVLLLIALAGLFLWQRVLEHSLSIDTSGTPASQRVRRPPRQVHVTGAITSIASTTPVPAHQGEALSISRSGASRVTGLPLKSQNGSALPRATLTEQLGSLLYKELICFWRDPLLKALIFQRLVYLSLVVLLNVTSARKGINPLEQSLVILLLAFFFTLSLSANTLGIERQSLTTLLLFPINRHHLLWGKNLAAGLLGLGALILVTVISAFLSGPSLLTLLTFSIGLSGLGVVLGVANVIAVLFPRYQRTLGRRSLAASGNTVQAGGCLNSLMALVGTLASLILVSPVVLGVGLPYVFQLPLIWLATIPLCLAYSVGLYIGLTTLSACYLLTHEPEILAITTRE